MRSTLLAALLLAAVTAGAARAHEMGAVEVQARFAHDGSYRIELPVDPVVTLQRLQLAADEEISEAPSEEAARQGIVRHADQLRAAVTVEVDGRPLSPTVECLPAPPRGGPVATVVLRGEAPQGARELRFGHSLSSSRYALRVVGAGEPVVTWIEADELSAPVSLRRVMGPTRMETARQYLVLGFTHIVPLGLDHILFVLGIFLLSTRLVPLLSQVTAFTVAHSITLGLAMYGIVSLPARIVEPLIALSIVYVALENVSRRELAPSRIAVVFGFGLLHGMGFAGVLHELGLPRAQFGTALLTFNVGVELGQLAVIAAAFLGVAVWTRHRSWYRQWVVVPASLAIAAVGLFWTVQRIWFGPT